MTTQIDVSYTSKFSVKPEIVDKCLGLIQQKLNIDTNNDVVINPNPGKGEFITKIKENYKNVFSYDLVSNAAGVTKKDYLEIDVSKLHKEFNKKMIHIIGLAPFGKQCSNCKKYVAKSCVIGNTISFILPKSFKRDTMSKFFDPYYHLILEEDIGDNSFVAENGSELSVPCVFQIWQKQKHTRVPVQVSKPDFFEYVSPENKPNVCIKRIGAQAGEISKNCKNKGKSTYLFLRINNISVDQFIEKYKTLNFFDESTPSARRSVSKTEINKKLSNLFSNI